MKDNLFYSINSGQVVRQLGFGFEFDRSYYDVSLVSKKARFSFSVSRFLPVLKVRPALYLIVKAVKRLAGTLFNAFGIVLSSPVH